MHKEIPCSVCTLVLYQVCCQVHVCAKYFKQCAIFSLFIPSDFFTATSVASNPQVLCPSSSQRLPLKPKVTIFCYTFS